MIRFDVSKTLNFNIYYSSRDWFILYFWRRYHSSCLPL